MSDTAHSTTRQTLPGTVATRTASRGRPQRRPSISSTNTRDGYERSGAPGSTAYDLPEPNAMAELELSRSLSGCRRLNRSAAGYEQAGTTANSSAAAGERKRRRMTLKGREHTEKHGHLGEEDEEARVDDELATHGPAANETEEQKAERMYARFSERRKNVIVAIVAYAALLAPFSSSSFLPSIPQIAVDLDTTPTILNVTVAVYIFVIGIVPLAWAPYAGTYGRRPIYCLSLPIFALGSLGVALSDSLAALIVTRIIQGAGSSAVLSVGAGTIGDLYPRQRRGKAMGYFYSGILIGPAVAPALAGILTEYVDSPRPDYGWRAMQWLLFAMGVSASALCFFCFPETIHERGIDARRREEAEARRREAEKSGEIVQSDSGEEVDGKATVAMRWWDLRRWEVIWLNPLEPLKLLLLPHILLMSLTSSFVLMSTYTVLVPLSQTVAPRYNITNTALLGCFYLAQGVGNACASLVTGRYADWTLKYWLKRRQGVYIPEDRLRATLVGAGGILPGSVLALGWVLDRVEGKVGLGLTVVLLFLDGVGLMFVLTPLNTYVVDTLQSRSSEAIAVNNAVRYSFSAAASAFVLPLINAIGVGWTNTLSTALCLVAFGFILWTIKFGGWMRQVGRRWTGEEIRTDGADEAGEKRAIREVSSGEAREEEEEDTERTACDTGDGDTADGAGAEAVRSPDPRVKVK